MFYLALRAAKVLAELHIFRRGAHGLGLATGINGTSQWSGLCQAWLENIGMVTTP
jgi:hypothetical protein